MHGEIAGARVEQNAALDAAVGGRTGGAHLAAESARRNRSRDAVVVDIDDPADCLRAVAQGCRSADHFDLLRRERVDRNRVVFAEVGNVVRREAVLLRAHAVVIEAAHDRPAGAAGREGRAGDARLREEEIAERVSGCAPDFAFRHHGHRRELIGDDRKRASRNLRERGCDRRRRIVWRRRRRGPRGACRLCRPPRRMAHDRAWRRHDDRRQSLLGLRRTCRTPSAKRGRAHEQHAKIDVSKQNHRQTPPSL
jgi:hypothetical protein